jgi:putative glutamine amidotransferase
MSPAPLIAVAPSTEIRGAEFFDYSVSLSDAYLQAVLTAGGMPWIVPCAGEAKLVEEYVSRADGVFLTGGDDITPALYRDSISPTIQKTLSPTDARRDLFEVLLVNETFKQRKPLLAICRGLQIVNVALGGTLFSDLRKEANPSIEHRRMDLKDSYVHKVLFEKNALIAQIFGKSEIEVNSSHHQSIAELAKPLQITGRAPDGIIEAIELREEDRALLPYFVGVQFHPERLVAKYPIFRELFQSFTAACALHRKQSL